MLRGYAIYTFAIVAAAASAAATIVVSTTSKVIYHIFSPAKSNFPMSILLICDSQSEFISICFEFENEQCKTINALNIHAFFIHIYFYLSNV